RFVAALELADAGDQGKPARAGRRDPSWQGGLSRGRRRRHADRDAGVRTRLPRASDQPHLAAGAGEPGLRWNRAAPPTQLPSARRPTRRPRATDARPSRAGRKPAVLCVPGGGARRGAGPAEGWWDGNRRVLAGLAPRRATP